MRNCAFIRSRILKLLLTERSTLWKPVSRKMFRPMVSNVSRGGGTKTDFLLGLTKHPAAPSVAASGAFAEHSVQSAVVCAADSGTGLGLPGVINVHEAGAVS